MTVLVGLGPQDDHSTIEFAATLARSDGQDLAVVSVVPAPWPTPISSGVDKEYAQWAASQGKVAADRARAFIDTHCTGVRAEVTWVRGRSAPAALQREAARRRADLIVLGSSRNMGRIAIGSTADALLHSSPIPVAIGVHGYAAPRGGVIGRATVAFRGDRPSHRALRRTAEVCQRAGASLRVVTFAVTSQGMFTAGVGRSERLIADQWVESVTTEQTRGVKALADLGIRPGDVEQAVARGADWTEALGQVVWQPDDVLVVGSSREGRLTRLFLGPTGSRIVRAAPVPVVVVR
ncbi:universal stress protein [Ornithinimicrobium sp. F0845]|uniref:universal stress protein n=1 Tax=Ornithinimicrobium sp. F0845 TaxID=2926412 RepID=UPI001FF45155|nr:universal stress protein [Ornithinimicrobium sp. F0845]MCK0112945.1 universal stress protein [Ornithinimicrobium sp. F0845]